MPKHISTAISRHVCVIMCALLGISCSSHPEPIVDTKGVDMTQYQTDLAECQSYAEQIDPATGVAKGAAGGAATGGAIGAISGGEFGQGRRNRRSTGRSEIRRARIRRQGRRS